jgi:hypothetical protein
VSQGRFVRQHGGSEHPQWSVHMALCHTNSWRVQRNFIRHNVTFPPGRRWPRYFLLCHSIELALKAYQRGEKRGGYQGWKLARAESIRPRLVITIQPWPRLSIDFTVPAPGMIAPGATSIEPRGLSTRAIPL